MVGVEVDFAILPADFIRIANTPAQRVENRHNDTTGKYNQPTKQ